MERPPHAGRRHLALNVRDLPAMKRFYVELLGFEVEWEPDPDNSCLSSGIDNLALQAGSRWVHRATARFSSAGAYILSVYSLTIRRAEKRGATVLIACLTVAIHRWGTLAASRS
jgi:catechol 2,3-dioxygenase-like lactoylglutathione lyase family enzyme